MEGVCPKTGQLMFNVNIKMFFSPQTVNIRENPILLLIWKRRGASSMKNIFSFK